MLIQHLWHHAVADAHLNMGPNRAAGKDCRILRLYCPDGDAWVEGFQCLADSGDGSAGSDAGTEPVNGACHLLQNLKPCVVAVDHGVGLVLKLLRHEHLWILFGHTAGGLDAFINTIADIAGIVYQNHPGSVMLYQKTPLLADRVGHDNHRLISLHRTYQCKTDALVAAGGLHNDRVFF